MRRPVAISSRRWVCRGEASLGMGYVHASEPITAEWLAGKKVEVEIGSERYEADAQLSPFYDPKLERVKG